MFQKIILLLIWLSTSFVFSSIAVSKQNEPIQVLPLKVKVDARKVELGKKLFSDKNLSLDNSTSCQTCHDLNAWGADKKQISRGVKNRQGTRNSPTVYNSGFNFKQFWDGRADTLSHQTLQVVVNPFEMGMKSWEDVINKIRKDPYYAKASVDIYKKELDRAVVSNAIAEYVKTLLTPKSPFDLYLKGDETAITEKQKRGYQLFKSYGCSSCHQGANVGGNLFQKFGVLNDISLDKSTLSKDLGRYNVTRNEWDKRVFKVPSLRLVTKTAPYFHDGSVKTIQEAVDIMIKYQLGRSVPEKDRDAIIAFLESLVGQKTEGVK